MDCKISKIILWPKNPKMKIRIIPFVADFVNVISGDNAKGKSAIISIIDYCLASSKCSIPIGYIRDLTSWFGIIIHHNDGEILLARKEAGLDIVSTSMYIQRGKKIVIPHAIEENANYKDIILELNKLAQLTGFDLGEKSIAQPASFRDLISLNFQPQHLVANPYALFYKADTYQNREKLITIFPYILGILNDRLLSLKEELKELQTQAKLLKKEIEQRKNIANTWLSEVKSYYAIAYELGLTDSKLDDIKNSWSSEKYVNQLRNVLNKINRNVIPIIKEGASSQISMRLAELDEKEYQTAISIQEKKEKLRLVENVKISNINYGNDIQTQNGRLDALSWLKDCFDNNTCPFCGSNNTLAKTYIDNYSALSLELNTLSRKVTDSHRVFTKEISNLKSDLNKLETLLNQIRIEKQTLSQENQDYQKQHQMLNSIFRFGGKLEESLKNYDKIANNGSLLSDLNEVNNKIYSIEKEFNSDTLEQNKKRILQNISDKIKYYARIFGAEYCNDNILFDIENLTLQFSSSSRKDFLWEIGSGHNFMSYHISTILAIHEYLLSTKEYNKVPSFIVFDQPSQVYFPELKNKKKVNNEEAVLKVKRIFQVLADFKKRTNSQVQVIIIEHAGEATWKDYADCIKLIRNWRGKKKDNALIPEEWIEAGV